MSSLVKRVIVFAVVLVLLGASLAWWLGRDATRDQQFRTATVTGGDLVLTIASTGTLKPQEEVDVGAQVAGQIESFGSDADGKPVDYGSRVTAGMVLAQIDDAVYATERKTSAAQLEVAKAGVIRAERDLDQLLAKLDQAKRDWERAQRLGPSDALAQASYDAYRSTFEQAKANVGIGEAAILQAKAEVLQAEAAMDRAERNLGFTIIKSPVDGVVIDRRVNIGQTVVASLNAPSLFLIATDLRKMRVWVQVNEADVGRVKVGQKVAFTVDALPGEPFKGVVSRVRLNASREQNVVTYIVEVDTDNAAMRLFPYQSASVRFEVDRRDNVLLVPNAALRYQPKPEQIAPDARQQQADESGAPPATGERPRRDGAGKRDVAGEMASAAKAFVPGTIWIRDGKYLKPISVSAGLTDGVQTEVTGDGITDGLEVIAGEVVTTDAASGQTNPFGPPQWRRSGSGTGGGGSRGPRGG